MPGKGKLRDNGDGSAMFFPTTSPAGKVPNAVWNYYIGGYQSSKWLSLSRKTFAGARFSEEVPCQHMARHLAALVALGENLHELPPNQRQERPKEQKNNVRGFTHSSNVRNSYYYRPTSCF